MFSGTRISSPNTFGARVVVTTGTVTVVVVTISGVSTSICVVLVVVLICFGGASPPDGLVFPIHTRMRIDNTRIVRFINIGFLSLGDMVLSTRSAVVHTTSDRAFLPG